MIDESSSVCSRLGQNLEPRMNLQQAVPPRSSANGFGRRRVDRETGARMDNNRMHSGKPTSPNSGNSCNIIQVLFVVLPIPTSNRLLVQV